MTPLQSIPADLVTPLGAYLRLRGERGGSFLLESVERGRLGRNSFVGWGSRVVSFEEAEGLGAPIVGYLSYDYAATLEPTVPMPPDGPGLPESRFVVVERLVRFDHGAGVAEVLVGEAADIAEQLEGPPELPRRSSSPKPGELERFPTQARYEEMVRRCKTHIEDGDAFQIVPSQRATRRTPAEPLELYRALRRVNPSPYLFLLELDELALVGSSPERLVACEDGRANVSPIAGTTAAGEGDVERLLVREGPRRARDARRPRAQRPLARVPRRHSAGCALDGDRALLARLAPRVRGRRRAA